MKTHRAWLLFVCGTVTGMVLASGCSTQAKRQWLTFFFDGVPQEKTNALAVATGPGTPGTRTNAQPAQAARAELPLVIHPPYADQKCTSCHESKYSQKMRNNLGDLCLGCHKDVLVQGKAWHAPAASGECVVCHEPHESSRKFLLSQSSSLLCARCHEPEEMARVEAHREQGKTDCTTCHNPHQSASRFLLKPKAAKTDNTPTSEPEAKEGGQPGAPTPATNTVPHAPPPANRAAIDDSTALAK